LRRFIFIIQRKKRRDGRKGGRGVQIPTSGKEKNGCRENGDRKEVGERSVGTPSAREGVGGRVHDGDRAESQKKRARMTFQDGTVLYSRDQ